MEQRPLRLGDLVDDYCPRERRVTNHAIVAIVNDAIRQTRCTTCDAEHVFKGAKPPRRRPGKPALVAPASATDDAVSASVEIDEPQDIVETIDVETTEVTLTAADAASEPDATSELDDREREQDIWPANRQLIRASLPRQEGDLPPPRPIPEFTIYQRQNSRGAGRGFRYGGGWHDANGNGNGNGNGHGDRRGGGNGQPGQGHGRRRHGKKRPR